MTTTIYALCEPDLKVPVIRYIGKTGNVKLRLRQHLKDSAKNNNHLGCWLRSLLARKERPILLVLAEVLAEASDVSEKLFIRLAREGGIDLVNSTEGGESIQMTLEICEKIRKSKLGPKNPNFGRDLSGTKGPFFGRSHSLETRKKISASVRLARRGQNAS